VRVAFAESSSLWPANVTVNFEHLNAFFFFVRDVLLRVFLFFIYSFSGTFSCRMPREISVVLAADRVLVYLGISLACLREEQT
jgi:hypothetical protein